MNLEEYKGIFNDSPIGCIGIVGIKNEDEDTYTGIRVTYINNALEVFLRKPRILITSEYILDLIRESNTNLDNALRVAKKKGKYTISTYLKSLSINLTIDIYRLRNDEYFVKFTRLEKETYQLSKTLKKSPFAAWIKDLQGRYIEENEIHNQMFGSKRDDIIGKTDYDIFDDEIARKLIEQDKEVIFSDSLKSYKHVVQIDEVGRKYFQTTKWPYKDENNLTIGTIGITIEITDSVELKKNIEKNDKIFSEIANNIEDIIMIRDKDKALYISPSFEKVFGYDPINLYEDINVWRKNYNKIESTSIKDTYYIRETTEEIMKLSKQGEEDRWIISKFVPVFDGNGNIVKKIGIISDITKRKKIEEEIEDLRMDFFANLSHELRTPINLILSCLEVLNLKLDNLQQDNQEYFDKYLKIINQNGLRLLKLVNNLIDSTRLDAGSFTHNPQNYDIVNFVEGICMSVIEFVELNNMSIIFDTNLEEKIVAFDLDSMERIILNLLSNAIKFNKDNGEIQVNIHCDDEIKISVKDSGIGIPQDKVDSIFGRFEQVRSKMKTQKEGSGIGLSLVKSLTEMHSGHIKLDTTLGKGSEFTIILPDVLLDKAKYQVTDVRSIDNVNKMKVEFSDIYV